MNYKKGAGILLTIIGIFIILIQPFSMTGAVIDLSTATARIWFFIGLSMMFIGFIFLTVATQEKSYKIAPLEDLVTGFGNPEEVYIVMDSSGLIDYKKDLDELFSDYQGRIFVPDSVREEVGKNRRLRRKLKFTEGISKNPKKDSEYYKRLRDLAQKELLKTKKHQDYLVLKKIIGEEKVPKGISDKDYKNYWQDKKIDEELNGRLSKEGKYPTRENQLELLEREYKVGKGDIDVLTTALMNARDKKKTEIVAEDTHIRDALNSITTKYRGLKEFLKYSNHRIYN